MRGEGGLGNSGGSNYMCPNYISGNGRNRGSFLTDGSGEPCLNSIQTKKKKESKNFCGRLREAVFKYYLNAIDEANADWQPAEYEEATPR